MLKRVDLHVHTRFSDWKHLKLIKPRDCYNEPIDVYRKCKSLGMDYVAITDHDTIDGAIDLLSQHPHLEPEVIIGEEVETSFPDSGQRVHINVFDVDEKTHDDITHLKKNIYELVPYLKRRGLLHVLNHPFQSYRIQKLAPRYLEEILELFDHFEVGNATLPARQNHAVAEMLEYASDLYTRKHGVGGSDAHVLGGIGNYVTEVRVDEKKKDGKAALIGAIARGEVRAAGRAIGAPAMIANVYRIIGRYYLSLREPRTRARMGVHNYLAAAILAPACLAGLPAFLNLGNNLCLEATALYVRKTIRKMRETDENEIQPSDLIEESLD